jgi:hypothetical protein
MLGPLLSDVIGRTSRPMKIKSISITWESANEKEIAALLSRIGGGANSEPDIRVEKAREVAYQPQSPRTKAALDVLGKCERVSLLRPEILEAWEKAFPHVDLAAEIAKAEAWAQSKDVKRSAKGWAKALNSWLGKAQDQSRGGIHARTAETAGIHSLTAGKPIPVDPAVDAWARDPQ